MKALNTQILVSAVLLSFSAAVWPQKATSEQVDAYVKERMQGMHIPGLSLAVVKDGQVIKASGYGIANLETNTPATPETMYKTASLSKSVIAAAILLLVQDGKLRLDDKVSEYLDGTPTSWQEITIRHLLTHTSGIVRDPADYHPYEDKPIAEIVQSVYPVPLVFQPGEKWLYSNVGYYVLAEIISKVSGEAWDKFIAERLFAPGEMKSTRTTSTTAIVSYRAAGYHWTESGMVNAENWIAVRPSGAFLSTVTDQAKWDALLDSDNILSAESHKLMWTPAILNDKSTVDYGFGWYVDSFLGRARIHHDGQFPGFRADYERFPDDKLAVIVLANSDDAGLESLALKIAGFYAPRLAAPPFVLGARVAGEGAIVGRPVEIQITAKDDGQADPDSLLEMEIWDAAGKAVYKENKANESFAAGQERTYGFTWTPVKSGVYTVNVGAYGPKWVMSLAWKEKAAVIEVASGPTPVK